MVGNKIGILITGWEAQWPGLEQCLDSVIASKPWCVVLAYDQGSREPPFLSSATHYLPTGKNQGKQNGEMANIKQGLAVCVQENPDYVLKITADDVLRRPEGLGELPALLGSHDICGPQWHSVLSTMSFFGPTKTLFEIWNAVAKTHSQIERCFNRVLSVQKRSVKLCRMIGPDDLGEWGRLLGYQRQGKNYPPCRI